MTKPIAAAEMLDREFLQVRSRLIEIAAALDRIERGASPDAVRSDPRMTTLLEAAAILHDGHGDRAERVQMLFSDPYDPAWRGGT